MTRIRPKFFAVLLIALSLVTFSSISVSAKDKEFEALVAHLTNHYRAKKVKIPLMWLARLAVRVSHPAGIRSFSLSMFENVQFHADSLDDEMKLALGTLQSSWSPLLRIRSREDGQIFAYLREDGKNLKIFIVSLNQDKAFIAKATLDPKRLEDFLNEPNVFGFSFGNESKSKRIRTTEE